ncbi:MAG: putative serine protease HhoB precursor [Pelotomaculum sp. PtaB.Bin104]|nr:MAG: putative serine protease HhoB precursor [Pelotomaculum sp. PtaB.Bin104]
MGKNEDFKENEITTTTGEEQLAEVSNERDFPENEAGSSRITKGSNAEEEGKPLAEAINSFDEEDDDAPDGRPLWLRLVALVAILGFLGLVAVTSWPSLRWPQEMAGLVLESLRLKKEIDPAWLKAVVEIDVVYREPGSTFAVAQKSGTGFNINTSGQIITNHHVVEGALNITVSFPDGKKFRGEYRAGAPDYDLAVINLQADSLPVVPLNMSRAPLPGELVRVVGNPLGLNNIVVEGKVIRYLQGGNTPGRVFSIDAPIFPGNSGSPVFDRNGQVVGVVFGRLTGTEYGSDPPGLAVPVGEVAGLCTGCSG